MGRILVYLFLITLFGFPQPSFGSANLLPTPTLTIDQAVHFISTDGSHVVVQPGTYEVKGTDKELRLILDGDTTPIVLSAQQIPFLEEVDAPLGIGIPLEKEGVYIAWLQPGNKGVEAMGSYNPVQNRGLNLFKNPGKLTSQNIRQLKSFAKRLAHDPKAPTLKNDWTQVVQDITKQRNSMKGFNVLEIVMMVMRDSIVDLNKNKQYFLKKLQMYNAMGKELSQYLNDLRQKAKHLRGSKKVQHEQLIHRKEKELQKLGEDAQLANLDVQNALQRQQQTLQMLSNISKMLHDTAMSVIRKIGCAPPSTC